MLRKTILFLFAMGSFNTQAQIIFENGYFVNNKNERITCLIKNLDWKDNPSGFEYKLSTDSTTKKATLDLVKEFGVLNGSTFYRFQVKIDRSLNDLDKLSDSRAPVFNEEILFLKILIHGNASLYVYEEGNLTRFFYSVGDEEVEQLIFKKYKSGTDAVLNKTYLQQINDNLICDQLPDHAPGEFPYNKKALIKVFNQHNDCMGSEITIHELLIIKRNFFRLTIRPGLNVSSLSINNYSSPTPRDEDLGSQSSFRIGAEFEFILPFNKNKWSIILEPTYQQFSNFVELSMSRSADVDYQSIEFPFGLRYSFYLSERSRLFINGQAVWDSPMNSQIDFTSYSDLEIGTSLNGAFGAGYSFRNRFNAELRYYTNRNILSKYPSWESNYSTYSFIFGYSIVK